MFPTTRAIVSSGCTCLRGPESLDRGPTAEELHVAAPFKRRKPGIVLVGFRRHPKSSTGFPTAVKSLVALRHVDQPKPWGEGPENESLADEVLDELYRRDLISATERSYFAGSCTRAEARAGHVFAIGPACCSDCEAIYDHR